MARIAIIDDAHWHDLRAKHCGGTETSALFGLSSYITKFELYHRKIGNIPEPDFSDNARIFWGRFLESSIAAGVAEIKGWKVKKVTDYMTNDRCPGHGATLDYEIIGDPRGPGVLEIKTCDFITFRNDWEDEVPPISYELQLQTQFACSGYTWGCIAVLIGGNDMKIFEYEARPRTIAKIEAAVRDFWLMVQNKTPPPPNFEEDHDVVSQLHNRAGGGWTNLTGNARAESLCKQLMDASKIAADSEKARKACRAELLTMLGNADTATCGDYKITSGMVAESEVAYTKASYRNVRVTKKK